MCDECVFRLNVIASELGTLLDVTKHLCNSGALMNPVTFFVRKQSKKVGLQCYCAPRPINENMFS
jgi:hypothetical protein